MAITKGKANAGQGGKIGHSNQNHWGFTEEVKDAARKWRRLQSKSEVAAGLTEFELANEADQDDQHGFAQKVVRHIGIRTGSGSDRP